MHRIEHVEKRPESFLELCEQKDKNGLFFRLYFGPRPPISWKFFIFGAEEVEAVGVWCLPPYKNTHGFLVSSEISPLAGLGPQNLNLKKSFLEKRG